MIQQIIHRLLQRRHFWRYATFSEVAELYASRLMRMIALNITASFISIFLFQSGYSIATITLIWLGYFIYKGLIALPAAKYAARFGPKHGMLLSGLLYIPSMILLPLVPQVGLPIMIIALAFQGLSATMYSLCFMVDFSKVKSLEHAGKEIAFMNIIEKVTKGISPLLGGLLAFMAGPEATMWAAAILFAFSSVPLFKTGEPIETHQRLVFRGFPWKIAYRSLIAQGGVGFDFATSGTLWTLFIVVAILGLDGDDVYVKLGALLSVVILSALASSYLFGRVIDRRRGGDLLKWGVFANSITHIMRAFTTTPVGVAGLNIANETVTTGYNMAFVRGMFDTADISGHRVTYLGCMEIMMNVGAALAAIAAFCLVSFLGDIEGLKWLFFIAAGFTLLTATAKFRLYQK